MKRTYLPRYLITRFLTVHLPGKDKDVAVFSSRRSGSTWLMEMIAQAKGMRCVIEPFYEGYIRHNEVLDQVCHQYISLSHSNQARALEYLQSDKPSRFCGPINPFKKAFRFSTSRRVIKSTNANALLPNLAANSDLELIYLIRHPIPQIISTRKYPYPSVLGYYVEDQEFVKNHLSERQRELAVEIYRSGSPTDQYLAGWCLDNLLPLKLVSTPGQDRVVVLTYEDLVLRTDECLRLLTRRFNLKVRGDEAGVQSDIPSWTSRFSSGDRLEAIRKQDKEYVVASWSDGDLSEFANLETILDVFNTAVYRIDSPFAEKSLRLPG